MLRVCIQFQHGHHRCGKFGHAAAQRWLTPSSKERSGKCRCIAQPNAIGPPIGLEVLITIFFRRYAARRLTIIAVVSNTVTVTTADGLTFTQLRTLQVFW